MDGCREFVLNARSMGRRMVVYLSKIMHRKILDPAAVNLYEFNHNFLQAATICSLFCEFKSVADILVGSVACPFLLIGCHAEGSFARQSFRRGPRGSTRVLLVSR